MLRIEDLDDYEASVILNWRACNQVLSVDEEDVIVELRDKTIRRTLAKMIGEGVLNG